jgi:RNA polymerase sigma factor (sigma-70 family)
MPTRLNEVVRHLCGTALREEEAGLTDGQLLGRFINHRDADAITALVRRHGPMVWGVCRRILPNHHDAEDAFQATFLVLVRQPGSVRQRALLGNYLYGVARQTALKARALLAKRRAREKQATAMPETAAAQPDAGRDLRPVLDQELSRLPAMYRVAIVLCDLEGKTRKEAARQLGVPEGTLAGRLTRGRALLAKRLIRRGLVVSGGALAGVLSENAAPACLPAAVMSATIEAVRLVASGTAPPTRVLSGAVASLTEGVLKTMFRNKVRTWLAVLLLLATAGAGAGLYTRQRAGAQQDSDESAAATEKGPKGEVTAGAELHVIGVYGAKDNLTHGKVTVEVRQTTRPVVLVLTAYYSVDWQVKLAEGVCLKQVVVSGYNPQEVRGLPAGVPVVNSSWFPPDGSRRAGGFFWVYEGNTVEYREMVRKLNATTGLPVATFQCGEQGDHQGDHFVVDGVRGRRFAQAEFPWRQAASREVTPEEMRKAAAGADLHVVSISRPASRSETVDVEVSPTPRPVLLVLSSSQSAVWNLKIADKARVRLVIIGGSDPHEIDGLPGDVPLVNRCRRRSHFRFDDWVRVTWPSDYEWDTVECRRMIEMLNRLTGLPLASFQGAGDGTAFVIDGERGGDHRQTEIKPHPAGKPPRAEELRALAQGAELHVASVTLQDRVRPVTIHVRPMPKPTVLALSSYDSHVWKLQLDDGARLKAVLLGGYYDQDIDGVPADVPLVRCHGFPLPNGGFPKSGFWVDGPVGDSSEATRPEAIRKMNETQYRDMVRKLNDLTGLPLATFQGEAETSSMVIDGVRGHKFAQKSLPPSAQASRQSGDEDPLADVADVPALDLRVGGDAKKRYFLVGKADRAPAGGYRLLVVLPGGDGSADFNPFIRRIHKNVLKERWLIAQLVAPQWDEDQFENVVWPTERLKYPAAKFTTEEFINDVVATVKARVKVDPKRVYLLGWSSGGPPSYASAARKESPVTGAFIAMSVFKPGQLPALGNVKGKAFYLLQSPDDRVTPLRFAEAAEKALDGAGARVHLERYAGGHGWQGNVWKMLGDGIKWLDERDPP